MIGRSVTLGLWIENDDDSESYCELRCFVTPPTLETYWEPRYSGDVQAEDLIIDGESVILGDHWPLVRQIIESQDIPERDYEC